MELVINGKKIRYIRTLHMTQCDCNTASGEVFSQESCFVIYDELNDKQELETHVLYFRPCELESICVK